MTWLIMGEVSREEKMSLNENESCRLLNLMSRAERMGGNPHKVMMLYLARKRRIDSRRCPGKPSSRPNKIKFASIP